jgi:hypothetical protein
MPKQNKKTLTEFRDPLLVEGLLSPPGKGVGSWADAHHVPSCRTLHLGSGLIWWKSEVHEIVAITKGQNLLC